MAAAAAAIEFGFTANQIVQESRVSREEIELLKTWLSTQKFPQLSDEQVVIFLLSCHNEQEATKETIEMCYSLKKSSPEIFDNWKLEREDLQKQLITAEYCIFPEKRTDGCSIIFCRLQDTTPANLDLEQAMTLLVMTIDAELYTYPPPGLVVLCDMNGAGLLHLGRIKPGLLKIFFRYLQEALPVVLKEIHVLNTVHFIETLMGVLKPFITKKILDMLHFHSPNMDMEVFYQNWIPKNCLPEDYGGNLPPVRVLHKKNVERLTRMQPSFEVEQLQRHAVELS